MFFTSFWLVLWKFMPIHLVEHIKKKGWLAVSVLVYPKFDVVEVRALYRPIKFFITKLVHPCLYAFLCALGPSNRKGLYPAPHQYPYTTKLHSCWHKTVRQLTFSQHPPNPDLSIWRPEKCDTSCHETCFHCFTVTSLSISLLIATLDPNQWLLLAAIF